MPIIIASGIVLIAFIAVAAVVILMHGRQGNDLVASMRSFEPMPVRRRAFDAMQRNAA
jgi:hypothetical protein